MPTASGVKRTVCRDLSTLGLTSGRIIRTAIAKRAGNLIKCSPDQRGRHIPPHKIQDTVVEVMRSHINSYGPCISHYRRSHAPNRLYLSPEFTISDMFSDFKEKYPDKSVHYSSYYRVVRMKISFVKLGEEECQVCDSHEHHHIHVHKEDGKEVRHYQNTTIVIRVNGFLAIFKWQWMHVNIINRNLRKM